MAIMVGERSTGEIEIKAIWKEDSEGVRVDDDQDGDNIEEQTSDTLLLNLEEAEFLVKRVMAICMRLRGVEPPKTPPKEEEQLGVGGTPLNAE